MFWEGLLIGTTLAFFVLLVRQVRRSRGLFRKPPPDDDHKKNV